MALRVFKFLTSKLRLRHHFSMPFLSLPHLSSLSSTLVGVTVTPTWQWKYLPRSRLLPKLKLCVFRMVLQARKQNYRKSCCKPPVINRCYWNETVFFSTACMLYCSSTGGCAEAETNVEKHTQTVLSVTRCGFVLSKTNHLDEPCDHGQLVQHS